MYYSVIIYVYYKAEPHEIINIIIILLLLSAILGLALYLYMYKDLYILGYCASNFHGIAWTSDSQW